MSAELSRLAPILLLALLEAVGGYHTSLAQPGPGEPTPRIALVLSGGGAKGFAHVGVLKVLEEMRVPVHLITATSMGSIIGGLYASGLSGQEIEEAMTTVDWPTLFRDPSAREDLDYRRKEDDSRYQFDLDVGVRFDGRIILPTGALAGQRIGLLLRKYTLHVSDIEDFDELPIPYRAVAADIGSGESYVFDQGDLARAMRASMSIPGVLAPVEVDGRLLVDGGVTDNMPVDLARSLGADVVIAVDVSSPMRSREELGNVFDIVGQLTSMLSRLNVEEQIPRADILIDPELGELSGGDYGEALEFVAIGEVEARRHAEELSRYAVSEAEYAVYRSRHRFKPAPPTRIDFVEITGNERVDRRVIEARMQIQAGDSLDPARIEEDVSAIHGLGDFTAVDWELLDRGDKHGVVIRVRENPWGPNYMDFGMLFDVDGRFTGRVHLRLTRLNARGAELRNDIQLGSTRSLETEFYQPVDFAGAFFVAPSLLVEADDQDVFDEDGNEIAVYEVKRRQAVLDAGIQIGRLGEVRLGVVRGKTKADVSVGSADLPDFDVEVGGLRGRLVLDRLDSASFPNRGYIASTDLFLSRGAFGADDSYDRLDVRGAAFWPRGRMIWTVSGEAAGSLGSDLPAYDQPTVGGFLSLSGLERGQLRGPYAGVVRGGLLYRLSSARSFVAKGVYVGGYAEAGNVWERSSEIGEDLIYSGTMLFGIDSFLGSLSVAYGVADTGRNELYVSLGQTF